MTCTVLLAVFTLGSCNGLAGNDEMDRYFQRSDTMTLSAGDAKQANAVTHTINPWPSYVGDRRIVAGAAKTQGAIVRYRSGTQPRDPLPAISGEGLPMGAAGATAATVDAGGGVLLGGSGVSVGVGGAAAR
ncbi:hypothetical protein V1289_008553 [Bradyrhizobium sp. AZCC 2289]